MDIPVRNYTVVEIPKSLHQKLKPYAVKKGTSVKALAVEAIIEFLKKEGELKEILNK